MLSAFEYKDITHPNYLRPAAVPWASVAPTIIFRGSRPWLAIGSPGSERITSAILQVLIRLQHQSPFDAVAAPRMHCSVAGRVSLEASRMRDDFYRIRRDFAVDLLSGRSRKSPEELFTAWLNRHSASVRMFDSILAEMQLRTDIDFATLSVAAQELRKLTDSL